MRIVFFSLMICLFVPLIKAQSKDKVKIYLRDSRWSSAKISYDDLVNNYYKISTKRSNIFMMLDSLISRKEHRFYNSDDRVLIQMDSLIIKNGKYEDTTLYDPIKINSLVSNSVILVIKDENRSFIVYNNCNCFSYNGIRYYLDKSIVLLYMSLIPTEYWFHVTPLYHRFNNVILTHRYPSIIYYDYQFDETMTFFQRINNKRKRKKLHW